MNILRHTNRIVGMPANLKCHNFATCHFRHLNKALSATLPCSSNDTYNAVVKCYLPTVPALNNGSLCLIFNAYLVILPGL